MPLAGPPDAETVPVDKGDYNLNNTQPPFFSSISEHADSLPLCPSSALADMTHLNEADKDFIDSIARPSKGPEKTVTISDVGGVQTTGSVSGSWESAWPHH